MLPTLATDLDELGPLLILLAWLEVLPLLNALWDWLSLGLTRGLLTAIRQGTHQGLMPLLWGMLDFLLAFVFLAGIVATVVAALALANRLSLAGGGSWVVDLGALFRELREAPGDSAHWWVYFMFLSTLIPTLIHLLVVGASVMQALAEWTPLKAWRERAAAQMDGHAVHRFNAGLYLTLVPMSGLVLPMAVMWGLFQLLAAHGGWLGFRVLDWAEMVVRWAGGPM
ncbi:MAG: hypothetical protein KDI42_00615 [Gammaproteobacteria bacterium]|nr:hypothetical protein [Gammaproteobacteria bacterium]